MVWALKKYFLFCDDKFFFFWGKYLGVFFCGYNKSRMSTDKTNKNDIMYSCTFCDFNTCKKTDFTRHFATQKHKINTSATFSHDKNENTKKYLCEFCEKSYNDRTGLWKHKKTCKAEDTSNSVVVKENINDKDQLILMLVKQNAELIKETTDFKTMMMEVIKNGTTSHSHNNTNSHNKAFNLQLFLNETCKDAMNINDFVESIKLQVSDLENVGEVGFVEGISTIIVKNLNALDITKRPIHCTDKKRETIYIKDENVWEKDESQCKIRKMIKKVVSKNQRLIPKFKEQNPEYNKSYSKVSDKYNKLIIESMGGSGDNDAEKEDKIVRNIVKNVVVDK
jgi:hypothetical protein